MSTNDQYWQCRRLTCTDEKGNRTQTITDDGYCRICDESRDPIKGIQESASEGREEDERKKELAEQAEKERLARLAARQG